MTEEEYEETEVQLIQMDKLQRQVQITKPNIQVTLVTDCPDEDMDYLADKAGKILEAYKR